MTASVPPLNATTPTSATTASAISAAAIVRVRRVDTFAAVVEVESSAESDGYTDDHAESVAAEESGLAAERPPVEGAAEIAARDTRGDERGESTPDGIAHVCVGAQRRRRGPGQRAEGRGADSESDGSSAPGAYERM
jgi:hypothetical protein